MLKRKNKYSDNFNHASLRGRDDRKRLSNVVAHPAFFSSKQNSQFSLSHGIGPEGTKSILRRFNDISLSIQPIQSINVIFDKLFPCMQNSVESSLAVQSSDSETETYKHKRSMVLRDFIRATHNELLKCLDVFKKPEGVTGVSGYGVLFTPPTKPWFGPAGRHGVRAFHDNFMYLFLFLFFFSSFSLSYTSYRTLLITSFFLNKK